MSYRRIFIFICDVCGSEREIRGRHKTLEEARRYAFDHIGWRHNTTPKWVRRWHGTDVCLRCFRKGGRAAA